MHMPQVYHNIQQIEINRRTWQLCISYFQVHAKTHYIYTMVMLIMDDILEEHSHVCYSY